MAKRTIRSAILDRRSSINRHLDGINTDLFRICDLAKENSQLINESIPSVVANIEILKNVINKLWEGL